MSDKLVGLAAFSILIAFVGVIVAFVPALDLIIVVVIVLALALYDLYSSAFRRRNGRQ